MKLITQESISAFNNNKDFKKGNTTVVATGNVVMMYLFGNQIAKKVIVDYDNNLWELSITNAGWKSNTTKERLNGLDGVHIQQKKGEWYLNEELWNGEYKAINTK